ncbi:MAG: CDP-glycerol glycerophosphotransferase family protein [Methanothrix sp.]|nr:CDP-glycerol glycerophosphotransferase family protein [Methanothrix sp.]
MAIEENANYAEELRRLLQIEELQGLLKGSTGPFTIRQLFINEYLQYVGLHSSNPQHFLEEACSVKKYNPEKLILFFKTILSNCLFKKSNVMKHIDVLILSRDRTVKVRTKRGELTGDYIFFSIVEFLKTNCPDIMFEIVQRNDLHFGYENSRLRDLGKAIAFGIIKKIQWLMHRRSVLSAIRAEGGSRADSCIEYFFSIRPLIRQFLYSYDSANMLSSLDPKIILANDDCLYTKPVIWRGLSMLILQSAGMAEALEECRSLVFEDEALLPDYYLSSGSYFADIKRRHHIARNVITTGLPRYDVLHDAPFVYSRDAFFREHRIDPGRKMLFWATQLHVMSPEENSAAVKAILGALKELEDVILVIKQHPAEGDEHSSFLKDMINEYNSDAILVPKTSDTYELLSVCDLHIARTSTTAREAVAMNKPVIILYLEGQDDRLEYVKEGVALGVNSSAKLKDTIASLLEDDSRLRENRNRYIEKYLYKIDGKATERVVKLMIEMLHREWTRRDTE